MFFSLSISKINCRGLFEEFEACETPEARFVCAMDNFQPLLLNHSNNGGDWKAHRIRKSQILKRQKKTQLGSQAIWDFTEKLIRENVEKGAILEE